MIATLEVFAAFYLLLILAGALYCHRNVRARKRRRLAAKAEAIRLGCLPVEVTRYSAWGLIAELELDSMGVRNVENLKQQLIRNQNSKYGTNKRKAD